MDIFLVVLSTVIGYLIGSVSISVVLSKLVYKSDVRNFGSHNAGATNMARVYGLTGGILTLIGDFLKAVISMLIPLLLHLIYPAFEHYELAYALAGMGCFVGHAFPLYFGFKGGKCVTVGAAIALMTDWKTFLIVVAVFFVTFLITRIVSVSSIVAALSFVITGILFAAFHVHSYMIVLGKTVDFTWYKAGLAAFVGLAVIFLHRANIGRLIRGEEKKFTYKKKSEIKDESKEKEDDAPAEEK